MFNWITVVCTGNICRSPFGEAVLKRLLPQKIIVSAGLITEQSNLVGVEADKLAQSLAKELGYSLKKHKAQQLSIELCQKSDLILIMEEWQKARIVKLYPKCREKIMLFSHWKGEECIPDPFQKKEEVFKSCFNSILNGSKSWAEKLKFS